MNKYQRGRVAGWSHSAACKGGSNPGGASSGGIFANIFCIPFRDARIYIRGQIFCGYPQFPTDTDIDLTEGDFLLN